MNKLKVAFLLGVGLLIFLSDISTTYARDIGESNCYWTDPFRETWKCENEEHDVATRILRGTLLISANAENSSARWNPNIDELPNFLDRIYGGSNTIILPDMTTYSPVLGGDIGNPPEDQNPEDIEVEIDGEFVNANNLVNNYSNFRTDTIQIVKTNLWKMHNSPRAPDVPMSRAYEILGSDILLNYEAYNFPTDNYKFKEMKSQEINYQEAVMALYKALGSGEQYKITHKFYKPKGADKPILITNSHFIEDVSLEDQAVWHDTYYSKIFVSRTLPETYWIDALNAKLVKNWQKKEYLTLGEFTVLLRDMMDLKGEYVMNETEQDILVAVYGKDLPYYLPSEQLDAVRYLVARGIVTTDMEFSERLTTKDMVNLLMRAKDEDSRLDFKKIDFEYSQELLDIGYYPTKVHLNMSPINNLKVEVPKSTATHYDYLVKVIPHVDEETKTLNSINNAFYRLTSDGQKKPARNIYISSSSSSPSSAPAEDTEYLGTVNIEGVDFYHFKVPVGFGGGGEVAFTAGEDVEGINLIKMPHGGGVYYDASKDGETSAKMTRTDFPSDFSTIYVDKTRKSESQGKMSKGVQLSKIKSKFTFTSTDVGIESLMWKGKPLKDFKGFKKVEKDTNDTNPNTPDNLYELEVESKDPYKELTLNLSYSSNVKGEDLVPTYVKDNKYALVSVNWLKKNGIIRDIVSFNEGKQYVLYSKNHNVSIDLENKVIVSGQAISEIIETDESPLVVVDPQSKDILVDYRAVAGISNDYIVVRDTNGNITLSTPKTFDIIDAEEEDIQCIANLMGNGCETIPIKKKGDQMYFSLEQTYPLANYFVYRSRKGAVREDFLLVAKPNIGEPDVKAIEKAKELFGIEFADNIDLDIYRIGSNILTDADDKMKFVDDIIFDDTTQEYYYKLKKVSGDGIYSHFKSYMEKEGNPSFALPLVQVSDKVIDMNVNIVNESLDLKEYPNELMNRRFQTQFFQGTEQPTISEMQLAVTGLTGQFYPYARMSFDDIDSHYNSAYLGSIPVRIHKEEHENITSFYQVTATNNNKYRLATIIGEEGDKPVFVEIFRGTINNIYSYGVLDSYKLTGFDDIEPNQWKEMMESLSYKKRGVFDFYDAYMDDVLASTDDLLTLSILTIITLIPRIMIFWFFAYACLGLIHDWRFVQTICAKTIDIYKVMSLGFSDVYKFHRRQVWISTFIGIVLVTMINTNVSLELISWTLEALIGLLSR